MKTILFQLSEQLGKALLSSNYRMVTAESCTGGMIAASLTDVAGSSAWFEGGFVTYSNTLKTNVLGVSDALLDTYGAVSEPVVRAMAAGAIKTSMGQVAVAVSGIAGPDGGSIDKPVGTVWIAWQLNQSVSAEYYCFTGDRAAVREQATKAALEGLLNRLAAL